MIDVVLPTIFVLLLWWGSTGILLRVNLASSRSRGSALAVSSLLLVPALVGLWLIRDVATPGAAALGLLCGLMVWAWQEMSYYAGAVTGPHRSPCPGQCVGWPRFKLALGTSLYHELAVVAGGGLLWVMSLGAVNRTAFYAYAVLWAMRWSAKLNVFLGVRNVNIGWLPPHLQYLHTYMPVRRFNALLPVSVVVGGAVGAALAYHALGATSLYHQWQSAMLSVLIVLGVLEHLFLVLPIDDAKLWRWAQPSGSA